MDQTSSYATAFRVSRVNDGYFRGFVPIPHFKDATIASRWQRVGDLNGSGF